MILQRANPVAPIARLRLNRMNACDISLERGRLRIVIATVIINVVAVSLLAFAPWSDWRTGWWQYNRCRMISFTPWYIVVGEFGIALALALLARTLRRCSWRVAIVAGITGGASIFACYAFAFLITERWTT